MKPEPNSLKDRYRNLISPEMRAKLWYARRRLKQSLDVRNAKVRIAGRCVVCDGNNLGRYTNPVVARIPYQFLNCRDCDYIFVLPPTDAKTIYEEHTIPDLGVEEWNNHYLALINKHAEAKGKLLEIGFGTASFLKLAHDDGWEVYGADLSTPQVEHARNNLHLPNISLGTIEELAYPDEFFDVVAGFNFLEHVPDPRQSLAEIRRILKPGGLLALMCPNIAGVFHWLMPELLGANDPLQITWVPPHHLSYFNKTNLRLLVDSCGFVVEEDASDLMSCLWEQFEPQLGEEATDRKLAELKAEISSSSLTKGDARVAGFREQIKQLTIERMTWAMLKDFMELEPLLGAEVGTLLISRKPT
ncbi:MAG TPA: class I SAM-dependent methyltransferase [Pyrinomonadaceae bacterium]